MSGMFERLRAEAERASAANKMALLHTKSRGNLDLVDKFSGRAAQQRIQTGGILVSAGSFLGMAGVAMANQAAAMGASGLLASASTAMAGLGTVAVGTTVLPAVTVAALGASVAGLAVVAASKLMRVNMDKGYAFADALQQGDKEQLQSLGKTNIGLGDWIKGARSLLVNSFKQQSNLEAKRDVPAAKTYDAAFEYEMEDLFGDAEDSRLGKQGLVDRVASEIWDKHGIVVTDDKVHACLGKARGNDSTYGKILGIDKDRGLVIQSIGRGQATIHNLKDFAVEPKLGAEMMVSYRSGQMLNTPAKDMSRSVGSDLGR
ncbi:hypothetical protein AU374_05992 [Cupriavidus metallidurans]|nr:hypothetical protein AU374_05992 [Cupriavidus metallidurans]